MVKPLVPNQNSFPSDPWNNPSPLGDITHLAGIEETTAVGPIYDPNFQAFTPQGPQNMLQDFRYKYPFVNIVPFPDYFQSFKLLANTAMDLILPRTVALVVFSGGSDYFITTRGNASVPTTGQENNHCIYRPDGIGYYVGGIQSISAIAPADCYLSMTGYYVNSLPAQ